MSQTLHWMIEERRSKSTGIDIYWRDSFQSAFLSFSRLSYSRPASSAQRKRKTRWQLHIMLDGCRFQTCGACVSHASRSQNWWRIRAILGTCPIIFLIFLLFLLSCKIHKKSKLFVRNNLTLCFITFFVHWLLNFEFQVWKSNQFALWSTSQINRMWPR